MLATVNGGEGEVTGERETEVKERGGRMLVMVMGLIWAIWAWWRTREAKQPSGEREPWLAGGASFKF
jgi:hypothetical protein